MYGNNTSNDYSLNTTNNLIVYDFIYEIVNTQHPWNPNYLFTTKYDTRKHERLCFNRRQYN